MTIGAKAKGGVKYYIMKILAYYFSGDINIHHYPKFWPAECNIRWIIINFVIFQISHILSICITLCIEVCKICIFKLIRIAQKFIIFELMDILHLEL